MFKVLLKVNEGQELSGQGKTIKEALEDVNPWNKNKIFFFKTKGELVLTETGRGRTKPKVITQHLWPMQFRRAFNKIRDTLALRLLIQRLEAGLKAGLTEKTPTEL